MNKRKLVVLGLGLTACVCWMLTSATAQERSDTAVLKVDQAPKAAPASTTPAAQPAAGFSGERVKPKAVKIIPLDEGTSLGEAGPEAPTFSLVAPEGLTQVGEVPSVVIPRGGPCVGTEITQNADTMTNDPGAAIGCANVNFSLENWFGRCFDGAADFGGVQFTITCVRFAVGVNDGGDDGGGGPHTVELQLFRDIGQPVGGCPPSGGPGPSAELVALTPAIPVLITTAPAFYEVTLPAAALVLPGTDVLLQIESPTRDPAAGGDGGVFRIGCNLAAQSGPSFIISSPCGAATWSDLQVDFGLANAYVMSLFGTAGDVPGACCHSDTQMCENVTNITDCLGPCDRFIASNDVDPCSVVVFDPPCNTPTPPNDNCLDRIALTGQYVCVTFDNTVACASQTMQEHPCGEPRNDVWYSYTIPAAPVGTPAWTDGTLVVSTVESCFDTIVEVYARYGININGEPVPFAQSTGCTRINNNQIQPIRCNDDILENPADPSFTFASQASYVVIDHDPGNGVFVQPLAPNLQPIVYKIRVGGKGFDAGLGQLNVTFIPRNPGSAWLGLEVGRCCIVDSLIKPTTVVDCKNLNQGNVFGDPATDCEAAGGFWTGSTEFLEGIDQPTTELAAGCKVYPCPLPGEACYLAENLFDGPGVQPDLLPSGFGTITRLIKNKQYFKYRLQGDAMGPLFGQQITLDTCGSGFDTFVEVYSEIFDPLTGDCITLIQHDSDGDGNLDTNYVNDECEYNDADGTANEAREGAVCFNDAADTASCLCINTNEGSDVGNPTPGIQSGQTIIICIGEFNPDREITGVNSIDPVIDEVSNKDGVLLSLTVTGVDDCFFCEATCNVDTPDLARTINETEPSCDVSPGYIANNNGGCTVVPTFFPPSAPPSQELQATLNLDDGPIYVCGAAGTIQDPNPNAALFGQEFDSDWYRFELTESRLVTWRVVRAEMTIDAFLVRRTGIKDPCVGVVSEVMTTNEDCTDQSLTVELCAGEYWAVVEADEAFKVPCNSEYVMCLSTAPLDPFNCCKGDMNNDGEVNGKDIPVWISTYVIPPVFADPGSSVLGPCGSLDFCRADINGDGALTLDDLDDNDRDSGPNEHLDSFVDLLLGNPINGQKPECPPKAICDDPNRCQFPGPAGGFVAATSDLNLNAEFRVADNFCPTESGDITQVCWYGIYIDFGAGGVDCGVDDGGASDDFTITYYENTPDPVSLLDPCPGAVKAGPFSVSPTKTPTGNVLGAAMAAEFQYIATHPAVPVVAGDCCWLEIVNNTTGNCFWLWVTSPTGDGLSEQHVQDPADGLLPTDYACPADDNAFDQAFCLNLRIGPTGCFNCPIGPDALGRCCYNVGQCVITTLESCVGLYNGYLFDEWACDECCPPPPCSVDCQPGDLVEPEDCLQDKNGGCNTSTTMPAFEDLGLLNCGAAPIIVCGESFSQFSAGGIRDTDWFRFGIDAAANPNGAVVTLSLEADTSLSLLLLDASDCDAIVTIAAATSGGDCNPVEITTPLTPGPTYVMFVGGSTTEVHDCVKYRAGISCVDPCIEECQGGDVVETEACGGDTNGGCNTSTAAPPFEPFTGLVCGGGPRTACGTIQATAGTRDTDWWGPITLAVDSDVSITIEADFPAIAFGVKVNPPAMCVEDTTVFFAHSNADCMPDSITECLAAGTWIFFVSSATADGGGIFDGLPCDPLLIDHPTYRLTVQCMAPCGSLGSAETCGGQPAVNCQSPNRTLAILSDEDQKFTICDDFELAGASNITQVCWWGFNSDSLIPGGPDCTPPNGVNDFTITICPPGPLGLPLDAGSIVLSQSAGDFALAEGPDGTMFNNNTVIVYTATLAVPLNLPAGCHWLWIEQSRTECFCDWFWLASDEGNERIAVDTTDQPDGELVADAFDMAWCLNVAPVAGAPNCLVFGACCDYADPDNPVCVDTTLEADCLAMGPDFVWTRLETCPSDGGDFVCPPPGDSCTTALDATANINGAPITGDNSTATPPQNDGGPGDSEFPGGSPSCQWNGTPTDVHNTLWWRVTVPANGSLTVETCASTVIEDTIIALYSGTCGGLVEAACDDDGCTGAAPWLSSVSSTTLAPGTTVYIMMGNTGSYGGSIPGAFQLDITSP